MKRQAFTIAIIDRRTSPPDVRVKHFTDHESYLSAMSQIMRAGSCHRDEVTTSTVTLFPENQAALFDLPCLPPRLDGAGRAGE